VATDWLGKYLLKSGYLPQNRKLFERREISNFRTLTGIKFDEINQIKKIDELFDLYLSLFRDEHKRGYYCKNPDCGIILPFNYQSKSSEIVCNCGEPLFHYYEKNNLIKKYGEDSDMTYNLVMDSLNNIAAFTCGKIISGEIYDALLGDSFSIHQIRHPEINNIQNKIYDYFFLNSSSLTRPVYFVDAGGVHKWSRHSLESYILSTKPLFEESINKANGRIVFINYFGSSMYKINTMLGFDAICSVGDLVYMGSHNVSIPHYIFCHFSYREIFYFLRNFLKEFDKKNDI